MCSSYRRAAIGRRTRYIPIEGLRLVGGCDTRETYEFQKERADVSSFKDSDGGTNPNGPLPVLTPVLLSLLCLFTLSSTGLAQQVGA
eukprot:1186166-Prorocentrum_minimum.AAC.4